MAGLHVIGLRHAVLSQIHRNYFVIKRQDGTVKLMVLAFCRTVRSDSLTRYSAVVMRLPDIELYMLRLRGNHSWMLGRMAMGLVRFTR